jgi:hypothetical protein
LHGCHAGAESLRNRQSVLLRGTGQEQDELLPAPAREQVAGPQPLLTCFADPAQGLVPGRMAPAVVDHLEMIDVEQQQGHRLPALPAMS